MSAFSASDLRSLQIACDSDQLRVRTCLRHIFTPVYGWKADKFAVTLLGHFGCHSTSFIKSIKCMNAIYVYIADINGHPCITGKKQRIKEKFANIAIDKIAVVIPEIESWYLAGLKDEHSRKFEMNPFETTDDITKERFDNLIPKKFESRIDFMIELLKDFSMETAKKKNRSFSYFIEKYNL